MVERSEHHRTARHEGAASRQGCQMLRSWMFPVWHPCRGAGHSLETISSGAPRWTLTDTASLQRFFALKGQPHTSPGHSATAKPCSDALGLRVHGKISPEGAALPAPVCRPFRAGSMLAIATWGVAALCPRLAWAALSGRREGGLDLGTSRTTSGRMHLAAGRINC